MGNCLNVDKKDTSQVNLDTQGINTVNKGSKKPDNKRDSFIDNKRKLNLIRFSELK